MKRISRRQWFATCLKTVAGFALKGLFFPAADIMAALEKDICHHRQFEVTDIAEYKQADPGTTSLDNGIGG